MEITKFYHRGETMKSTFLKVLITIVALASIAAAPLSHTKFQAFDANGDPLTGGFVFTYEPGTTTKKTTYSDYDLATPNTNPIVLDSRGEAVIYLDGTTKLVLSPSTDSDPPAAPIWTMDNVESIDSPSLVYYVSAYDGLARS